MMVKKNGASGGAAIVVAPQTEAAYAGARILEAGGNAADATVTAALVQGIVDPHRCGLGGFGCSTAFFPKHGEPLCIDFHGRSGRLCHPAQWEEDYEGACRDGFGFLVRGKVNDVGYASITTPGMVAGLTELHQRYGVLPWSQLVLAAVPYAEEGFLVPPQLADFWRRGGREGRVSTLGRLRFTEEGARITLKEDGTPREAGDVFKQPVLAATLRRLAGDGPESYYRGALGRSIAADFEANGALVTREDLEGYATSTRPPLRGTYKGYEVLTTPLPGGGVALLQALKLLEGTDLPRLGHNSVEYVDHVAPIFTAVWSDRLAHHGDPKFGGHSEEHLLSAGYLERLRPSAPPSAGADSESTTQLSVYDDEGNAVSFSHSLGYGSGVFTPGLGFMYNNCMSAFDPRPGHRNSIDAAKVRSTAVAETILLEDGKPALILGSPGAARITAALVQVIVNVVDFHMTVSEAVVQPRFDAFAAQRLVLESRFPLPLTKALRARGWDVDQGSKAFGLVGRVYAVEPGRGGRPSIAGVDPGEPGAAWRPA